MSQMLAEHCTNGVNAWISSAGARRVIYLDCAPILSPSVLDRTLQLEKDRGGNQQGAPQQRQEFGSTENTLEVYSLQVAGFLFNVCHVVLFVQVRPSHYRAMKGEESSSMHCLSCE